MPMELLFALAQRGLPQTVHNPSDIDKLRVIAAAELVQARLPEVGAAEQKAEVLSITAQGRAALTIAYPQHRFDFGSAHRLKNSALADWLPSQDTYQMRREASRTLLDS